jgi:uncharacterized protein YcnI
MDGLHMSAQLRVASLVLAFAVGVSVAAEAHVTIAPSASQADGRERYTVRVPTERDVPTTSVELQVPAGVTIVGLLAPAGFTYELKKEGDRIVAVTWRQEIKPGEFGEFVFQARNPKGAQIVWPVRQHYADGTTIEWSGPAGSKTPAPVTTLKPGTGR